jgi:diacylglycerol O-acyltransferase / wax synthase
MVWLARSGLTRFFTRHQRLTNIIESNVTGPAAPIRMLGAPVLDVLPVSLIAGNLTAAFLAFSYAGRLSVTICVDADQYPDLPVLVDAVHAEWTMLAPHS